MNKINKFEKSLLIKFKKKSLLVEALTHKSSNQKVNNEKLEFLGDRVIGLVLSKKIFDLYPDKSEGVFDKRFARLVNRKVCCEVGMSIGIHNYIIVGDSKKKITINDEKIISDACEALVAAIFLDQGFEVAKSFILKIWKKNIENSSVTILDPKTQLQEFSLKKYKKLPIYRVITSKGPRHKPIYKIGVSIIGSKEFVGMGNSKQSAEQDAASKLVKSRNAI